MFPCYVQRPCADQSLVSQTRTVVPARHRASSALYRKPGTRLADATSATGPVRPEVMLIETGRTTTDKIEQARQRMAREIFETREDRDVDDLVRLMSRFIRAFRDGPGNGN